MLKSIQLHNFKAFGLPTAIPLAPITLIYGENSAGKSSIMQSLALLKQTRESRDRAAALLPRSDVNLVDLGSFNELIFDHDTDRTLKIRLAPIPYQYEQRPRTGTQSLLLLEQSEIEFEFSRKLTNAEIQLDEIRIYSAEDSEPFAIFSPYRPVGSHRRQRLDQATRQGVVDSAKSYLCSTLSRSHKYWMPSFEYINANFHKIAREVTRAVSDMEARNRLPPHLILFSRINTSADHWKKIFENFLSIINTRFSIEKWIEFAHPILNKQEILVNGFLPVPQSNSAAGMLEALLDADMARGHLYHRQTLVPDPVTVVSNASELVDVRLGQLFPLGPFRRAPERYYMFAGSNPADVGFSGDSMPDLLLRNKTLLKNVNKWLGRLRVGHEIILKNFGKTHDLYEIRLKDTLRKSKVTTSLSDVGFGISQLLPFIVQSLAGGEQIIAIEQPEVHVHPRLQGDIGELLLESITVSANKQFLIETHSENLILRIQKLVRSKRLGANQVAVLFVSRTTDGAQISRLRLDENGDFIDDWPGGFFPERIRELM